MFDMVVMMLRALAVCTIILGAICGVSILMIAFGINSDKVYTWFKWLAFILSVMGFVGFACIMIINVLFVW